MGSQHAQHRLLGYAVLRGCLLERQTTLVVARQPLQSVRSQPLPGEEGGALGPPQLRSSVGRQAPPGGEQGS